MIIIPDFDDHDNGRSSAIDVSSGPRLISRAVYGIANVAKRSAQYLVTRKDANGDEMTEEECHPAPNIDLCEKQAAASHLDVIVPAVIVTVLLIGLFSTLCFFHVRRQKRDEAEWSSKNNHEMEDYGFEIPDKTQQSKR